MHINIWFPLMYLTLPSSEGVCENEYSLDSSSFGFFQACRSNHIKQALHKNIMCKPAPVIVKLPWPNNTDIQQMTPTHIEVLQCNGGCHRNNQGCTATQTVVKKIPVMLGKCGINTGKCEKECAHVSVEEHTECGCACELRWEDCESDTHTFNQDLCSCQCKDTIAKRQCLDQGRTWSEETCSCNCPAITPCSIGMVYSNVTCNCITEVFNNVTDLRLPRSNKEQFFSWQIIVIFVLLFLIFVLLVTIFGLISKLHSVRRKIKIAKYQADKHMDPNNMYDLYNEQPVTTNTRRKDHRGNIKDNPVDKFYTDIYCESPSSGFGSVSSKYSAPDLRQDANTSAEQESIYHTAETVRLNKKLQNNSADRPDRQNVYSEPKHCCQATDPIDEAVRLLEQSAALL